MGHGDFFGQFLHRLGVYDSPNYPYGVAHQRIQGMWYVTIKGFQRRGRTWTKGWEGAWARIVKLRRCWGGHGFLHSCKHTEGAATDDLTFTLGGDLRSYPSYSKFNNKVRTNYKILDIFRRKGFTVDTGNISAILIIHNSIQEYQKLINWIPIRNTIFHLSYPPLVIYFE